MYKRALEEKIKEHFFQGKAIVIVGARQVGKTTLVYELIKTIPQEQIKLFNGDKPSDRDFLANRDLEFLKQIIGDRSYIIIDEGQKIENIGQTVKLMVDFFKKQKQIIVTGSSSIHLLSYTAEALTGRKFVYNLFPLSLEEIYGLNDYGQVLKELELMLIFGMYPDVVQQQSVSLKQELLTEITSSYLYKDILEFQQIKSSNMLYNLLRALAFQIGSEVSYTELANLLGINRATVENYIDLLEKSFVIFRLPPFTKNKRREISKLRKIYFYDLGVRNAIINNFNLLDQRDDVGALWENFMIVERMKRREYNQIYANQYFWRTYDGSEVDLVEEREGKAFGFEFKWGAGKVRKPATWLADPNSSFTVITKEDLKGFVL